MGVEALAEGLADVLGTAWKQPVSVSDLRPLTGGASRQIWSFNATSEAVEMAPCVLRRDPPGHGDAARMRSEVACLTAARSVEVPVPRVLAFGDDAPGIDAPFIIMDHIEAESFPKTIQRADEFARIRTSLANEMGRSLALIHKAPLGGLNMLSTTDPAEAITAVYHDLEDPLPTVELGLRWLAENRPPQRADALVHADYRLGNLMISPDGIQGVLDWELAHVGNPIEDLGWLCVRAWRFGARPPVAGIGERSDLLDGYESEAGFRPTGAELHYWEVFGTLRWLVLSRFQAERHVSGHERSTEFAAIGRRVCENEFDLLLSLGLVDLSDTPPDEVDRRTDRSGDLFGDPDVTDLLQVAIDALTGQVNPAIGDRSIRYQSSMVANLLRATRRELLIGDEERQLNSRRLAAIGCADEAELAGRIRSGELGPDSPGVLTAITGAVRARLLVSNPRHLSRWSGTAQ